MEVISGPRNVEKGDGKMFEVAYLENFIFDFAVYYGTKPLCKVSLATKSLCKVCLATKPLCKVCYF